MDRWRCPASLFVMRWVRPDPHYRQCLTRGWKSAAQWGKTNRGQVLPRNERTFEVHVFLDNLRLVRFVRTSSVPFEKSVSVQSKVLWATMFPAHVAFRFILPSLLNTLIGWTSHGVDLRGREFGWAFKQQLSRKANKQQIECLLFVFKCLRERLHLSRICIQC